LRFAGGVVRPPEEIDAGPIVLRRCRPSDADALATAVAESSAHLEPWMPWAAEEAINAGAARRWAVDCGPAWEQETMFQYLMWEPDRPVVVGAAGLHRRIGPGGLDIGYWVHAGYLHRGYATAAARALTDAGLALPGIGRVEIHCDVANIRSAAVARRLGYRLAREEEHSVDAPGEAGRHLIWALER